MANEPAPDQPIPQPPDNVVDASKRFFLKPHTFKGITSPDAGKVPWLIDGIIPRNDAVLWAATWKTAKTLCAYRLILDALLGRPVWGRYRVERPLRILCLQLEMPGSEDERRFRRLCLGIKEDPKIIIEAVKSAQFRHFSRPRIDLTDPDHIKSFHEIVRKYKPDLVVIDSAVAAFCAIDLNSNSAVRKAFQDAILPLTSEGIAVLLLHHLRKLMAMEKHGGDRKSMVLGAGQFGAASGRTYSLERLTGDDAETTAFTVQLAMLGGWTPTDYKSTILRIEDTEDGTGTTIEAVDMAKEPKKAKVTTEMRAAIAIRERAQETGRVSRQTLFSIIITETGFSPRVMDRGLDYATSQNWVELVPAIDAKHNEKDVVPYVYDDENETAE